MSEKRDILYVDDEKINIQLFAFNLKKSFNVHTAASGLEGLDKLAQNPQIALVISDMKMPGMDGLEFIRNAKKKFPSILFFILTGYDVTEEIKEALKDNLIVKYFRKPFDFNEVVLTINESLRINNEN